MAQVHRPPGRGEAATDPEILHEWGERVVAAESDRLDDEAEEQLQAHMLALIRQLDNLLAAPAEEWQQIDPATRRFLAEWPRDEPDELNEVIETYRR